MHIRRGRLARIDAIAAVRRLDGRFPWTYLDVPLERILDEIDISLDEFFELCDKFTNKRLFKRDASGSLIKDRRGNLTKINYDNL
jgi:hypothetical protein